MAAPYTSGSRQRPPVCIGHLPRPIAAPAPRSAAVPSTGEQVITSPTPALFIVGGFCRINPFFISTADYSAMAWHTFVALVVAARVPTSLTQRGSRAILINGPS
jgi:hypothetical protein